VRYGIAFSLQDVWASAVLVGRVWRCPMKTVLIVPDSPARKAARIRQRSRLTSTTKHVANDYGMGVIVHHKWAVLDGYNFRVLRETLGARIVTTNPKEVCRALGLSESEPGIERVAHD
jgi:hypothetical protein